MRLGGKKKLRRDDIGPSGTLDGCQRQARGGARLSSREKGSGAASLITGGAQSRTVREGPGDAVLSTRWTEGQAGASNAWPGSAASRHEGGRGRSWTPPEGHVSWQEVGGASCCPGALEPLEQVCHPLDPEGGHRVPSAAALPLPLAQPSRLNPTEKGRRQGRVRWAF
jgi:hypothetical protein